MRKFPDKITNDSNSADYFRIVRNKAAEKVKEIGGYDSPSPGPLPALTADTHHALRHPAYSINNILGMHHQPQQDANENILKRKRDEEGNKQYFLPLQS